MTKSPDAFRTISEVAEWLDRPAHVLRFWESKFTQVKPIKRAGGRRYYRPDDMLLLGGIKRLLHDDGLTIKGVQKMLRDQGVEHVAQMSQPLDVMAEADQLVPSPEKVAALKEKSKPAESATLLQFPGAEDAAEQELSTASYEEAAQELAPVAEPEPVTEADPEPVPDPKPEAGADFEAPSFFSMFDTPEEPEAQPDSEDTDVAADTAPEPQSAPADDAAPTVQVVEVAVDASSDLGPGVLTRLLENRRNLGASDHAQLRDLREKLRQIGARKQTG